MKAYVIVSLLILSLICLLVVLPKISEKSTQTSVGNSRTHLDINKIDKGIFTIPLIHQSLKKSYYSNQEPIQFSSVGLLNPNPDLYNLYWSINNIQKMGLDKKELAKYIKYLPDSEKSTAYPELLKINYITGIYKALDFNDYDKQHYLKILMKHYDVDMGLFYFDKKDDPLGSKLGATMEALDVFESLDQNNPYREEMLEKNLMLLNDDKYFESTNVYDSLSSGAVIISIIKKLGYHSEDLNNKMKDRMEWVSYINNNLTTLLKKGELGSFLYLRNIKSVNDFFGLPLTISKENLDLVSNAPIQQIEPQLYNFVIEIYDAVGSSDYPYLAEYKAYIEQSMLSGFNKGHVVTENVEDNYYGLVLSKDFQYKFDEERIHQNLNLWYIRNVEENSNITDYAKLRQIYFLLLSNKLLNVSEINANLISKSVINYLSGLDLNDRLNLTGKTLNSYEVGLKIFDLLNVKVPDTIKKNGTLLINQLDQDGEIYKSISVVKLYNTMSLINYNNKMQRSNITTKISETLNSLYTQGGYKSKVSEEVLPSIVFTYEAALLKKSINTLDVGEINGYKNFLTSEITKDLILGYSNKSKSLDLRSLYYGCLLSTLYKS
ncbi:hypothetical protein N0M98_29160 [Paenibacillus doosanensis]|uniref:hypothetical protein n=1 Tax=Paenibacillus doosanensis TaxID=1229154 RepID=UPI00217FC724|nr:hypothetical protein [Paenibacillus doosanensis]MCS7464176.1 hypothetical protein [Paenibacillus doosanensis]